MGSPVVRLREKYSDDQPRDEGGRWSDGGGGGGSTVTTDHVRPKNPNPDMKVARGEGYSKEQKENLKDLINATNTRQASGELPRGVRSDAKLEGEKIPVASITSFVESFAAAYPPDKSKDAFILKYGEEMQAPDAPPSIGLMAPKMCYESSAKQSEAMGGEYGYAEGYVLMPRSIPIEHAWNYDLKTGAVVDHTLGWQPKAAYFGVKIPEARLRKELTTSRVYGALSKDWRTSELVREWVAEDPKP